MRRPVAYLIEPARAEDLAKLAQVEIAANALFAGRGIAGVVANDSTSLEELAHAHAAGLLWVARDAGRASRSASRCSRSWTGSAHLEEIDVHPAHGRRGVGRALLDAVVAWARGAGHRAVTLTTFRDIPWNAPFYERAGFRALAPHELGPGLAAVVRDEAARGLDPAQRVAMRRDLAVERQPG